MEVQQNKGFFETAQNKKSVIITEKDLRVRERETGIDILRILAMLMVVIQHCLLHGMLLNHGAVENRIVTDTVYTFCRIAVNVYAAITGYVCINSKFRLGRILLLYLQVVFYSAGLIALVCALQHAGPGEWAIKRFFPVANGTYWYFTSYIPVAFLIPFLNPALKGIGKTKHRILILICGILFSCVSVGGSLLGNDPMRIGSGYSALWLIVMYVIGAYIKLYPEDVKNKYAYLGVYFACMILSSVLRRILVAVSQNSEVSYTSYAVSYVSPLMFVGTFALVAFFSKVRLPKWNPRLKRFIAYISTLAFGVYLIHDHPLVREYYMKGSFSFMSKFSPPMMFLCLMGAALAIYIACTLVDAVRKALFRAVRLDKFADWAGDVITRSVTNIAGGKKRVKESSDEIFESENE